MNEFSVTPLGTVAPYPKGNKNCPGFLVRSGNKKVLLDCGSGVSRLMNFPEDLKDLIIIISHLHEDHYSDLSSFTNALLCYNRLGILDEKIKVYLPYLFGALDWNCYMYHIINSNCMELIEYSSDGYLNVEHQTRHWHKIEHGDMKFSFFKNSHVPGYSYIRTYSTRVESNGKIIVYTADTEYNDNLIEFCKNADLLITEATFLKGQPKTEGHMFAYEAGLLAKNAKVKKLMLTHFWPEIDKKEYVNEAKEYFKNVVAAEEGKKLILSK